jgi:hypothetical protein
MEDIFDSCVRDGYEEFVSLHLPTVPSSFACSIEEEWGYDFQEAWLLIEHSLSLQIFGMDYSEIDEGQQEEIDEIIHRDYWNIEDDFLSAMQKVFNAHNMFFICVFADANTMLEYQYFVAHNSPLQEVW